MTDHDGTAPGPDRAGRANPVAAIAIHGALTALGLVLALQAGLPLAGAAALAWAGGAAATVALLLAQDAGMRRSPVPADGRNRPSPATAPDL